MDDVGHLVFVLIPLDSDGCFSDVSPLRCGGSWSLSPPLSGFFNRLEIAVELFCISPVFASLVATSKVVASKNVRRI